MIVETGKYYLYRHIRLDTNEVFYVGMSKKREGVTFRQKYVRMFVKSCRNKYWKHIAKKYGYYSEIILESDSEDFIYEKEKEFINIYGRVDLKTGPLVNMNDGGKHFVISEETKIIFSKRKKEYYSKYRGPNFGKTGKDSPLSMRVYCYNIDGSYFRMFYSMGEAASFFNKKRPVIVSAVKHERVCCLKKFFLSYKGKWVAPFKPPNKWMVRRVYMIDDINNTVVEYESCSEAAYYGEINASSINRLIHCKGSTRKTKVRYSYDCPKNVNYDFKFPIEYQYSNSISGEKYYEQSNLRKMSAEDFLN